MDSLQNSIFKVNHILTVMYGQLLLANSQFGNIEISGIAKVGIGKAKTKTIQFSI